MGAWPSYEEIQCRAKEAKVVLAGCCVLLRAAAIAGLLPPPDHSMVSRDLQCKVGPSIDAG